MAVTLEKRCILCGLDVSQAKRTKDAAGRYYCNPCYTAASGRESQPVAGAVPTAPRLQPVRQQPPTQVTTTTAPSKAASLMADLTDPTYANSPILKMSREVGAKMGWKPTHTASLASIRAIAVWAFQIAVVLIGMIVFLTGSRAISMPVQPGGMTAVLMLVGVVTIIAFIPVAIVLTIRLVFAALLAQSAGSRGVSIAASVILLIAMIFAWPRTSEVYGMIMATQSADTSFVTIDSKFGFGVINNPGQFGKTTEQVRAEAERYFGATVNWKGLVTDVRDGQVLIQMRKLSLKNEVVLKVGWWDEWKLEGVKRDDLVEFSGVLAAVGDPYVVTNGFIKSSATFSPGEVKSAWPD